MTSAEIFSIILAIIASGGFWSLVQTLIKRRDDKENELKNYELLRHHVDDIDNIVIPLKRGEMAILHEQILDYCQNWLKAGYFPREERERIKVPYSVYIELGGNGEVSIVYKKCMELPFELPEGAHPRRRASDRQ